MKKTLFTHEQNQLNIKDSKSEGHQIIDLEKHDAPSPEGGL